MQTSTGMPTLVKDGVDTGVYMEAMHGPSPQLAKAMQLCASVTQLVYQYRSWVLDIGRAKLSANLKQITKISSALFFSSSLVWTANGLVV